MLVGQPNGSSGHFEQVNASCESMNVRAQDAIHPVYQDGNRRLFPLNENLVKRRAVGIPADF